MGSDLERFYDPGLAWTPEQLEAFDPISYVVDRRDRCLEFAPLVERRSLLRIDGDKFWHQGAQMLIRRAQWYGQICGAEGLDPLAVLAQGSPRADGARAVAKAARELCEDGGGEAFWFGWSQDVALVLKEVVSLGRSRESAGVGTVGRRGRKDLNRVSNALLGEMVSASGIAGKFRSAPKRAE